MKWDEVCGLVMDSDRQSGWLLVIAICLVRARSSWFEGWQPSRVILMMVPGMKMKWD